MRHLTSRSGLTLIELLVVVAVVGVMVALLLPAVQAARMAAHRARCISNLRQLGVGLHSYHETARVLPGYDGSAWTIAVLPHLEQKGLYAAFNINLAPLDAGNSSVNQVRLAVFTCPAEPETVVDPDCVVGNYGLNAVVAGLRFDDFRDGASQTALGFDIPSRWTVPWALGPESSDGLVGVGTHADRRPMLLADGSVRPISSTLDEQRARALVTPDGGEIIEPLP